VALVVGFWRVFNSWFDLKTLLSSLNHLLAQESWANGLLRKHSGKTVRFNLPITQITMLVGEDGYLQQPRSEHIDPNVVLDIGTDVFMAYLSDGKDAASRHVKMTGDVDFAQAIAKLTAQLRWEYEEDLSKLVGDSMAHAIVKTAKKTAAFGKTALSDLKQSVVEFLIHERPTLVAQEAMVDFKASVKDLRDDVERLEKRIERLMEKTS
jgi:ubiquinone biosynthesis protein UbiJ